MKTPTIRWEFGTAYEFFVSLYVLHHPENYGLDAAKAASILSDISAAERKFLEEIVPFIGMPLAWATELPDPKDAMSVLWGLRQTPAQYRLSSLMNLDERNDDVSKTLLKVIEDEQWSDAQFDLIAEKFINQKSVLTPFLDWCVKPEACGEALFLSLQAYYKVYFDDEEKRIEPFLQAGLEKAKTLAEGLELKALMQALSQSIAFDNQQMNFDEILFIPAFWATPLALLNPINKHKALFLFGARPANMAAFPAD